MRLELGSGYSPLEGFYHVDLNPRAPELDRCAPAYPLPWCESSSVAELRAVDVLEHLPYRQTAAALAEWARVLQPGGLLYVQVPDAEEAMRWYLSGDARLLERLPDDLPATKEAGISWRLLGGQDDGLSVHDGDDWRLNAHYALFSWDSLALALDDAGLAIQSMTRNEHPNLCVWAHKP